MLCDQHLYKLYIMYIPNRNSIEGYNIPDGYIFILGIGAEGYIESCQLV